MLPLPCAQGGREDGVCMALTQLSRELLDAPFQGDSAPSTSGCDSSDCLFCQYRSHSPFHLHAYASKITLLRKRSTNNGVLTTLDPFSDSVDQGSALLVAAFAGFKRQRTTSSTGQPVHPPALSSERLDHAKAHLHPAQRCRSEAQPRPGSLQPQEGSDLGSCPQAGPISHADATATLRSPFCSGRSDTAAHRGQEEDHDAERLADDRLADVRRAGPGPASCRHANLDRLPPAHRACGRKDVSSAHPPAGPQCPPWADALPAGWFQRPEWADQPQPAPAQLAEIQYLPSNSNCRSGRVRTEVRGAARAATRSSEIVCALEFSPDGRLLAAGGVDKQIRLFNLSGMLDQQHGLGAGDGSDDDEMQRSERARRHKGRRIGSDVGLGREQRSSSPFLAQCAGEDENSDEDEEEPALLAGVQRMPSKISSMSWSPFMDGVLTVGDYDGVLLQLHMASGHQLADIDAHAGRKIWSVAHSSRVPHLAASAADDRCARLWAGRGMAQCVAVLQPNPKASVCCVDFSPSHDHMVALACSDRAAYVYDTRSLGAGPLAALHHHSRPASYCRFMEGDRLVTAATDASIALWDLGGGAGGVVVAEQASGLDQLAVSEALLRPTVDEKGPCVGMGASLRKAHGHSGSLCCSVPTANPALAAAPRRVFRGHCNEKNFVGLSVRPADGLIACGSECSRAFVYHTSWSDPLATLDLLASAPVPAIAAPDDLDCGMRRRSTTGTGSASFVSAVCWQPSEAAASLGLPPLLAAATSFGGVSLSVLAHV